MNSYQAQLKLFDIASQVIFNYTLPRFFLKWHDAVTKAGLHYDLRIEHLRYDFNRKIIKGELESFVIKTEEIQNSEAKLVNVHNITSARREGTIIDDFGAGSVLHFDEGYFSIRGIYTTPQLVSAFKKGFENGDLILIFDGLKMKGKFRFKRKYGNKWQITKINDEWSDIYKELFSNKTSILPEGNTLQHYCAKYENQVKIYNSLSKTEKLEFKKLNNKESFRYKNTQLPERTHKIFPID